LRGLGNRVCRLRAHFGKRMAQSRKDVGNEGRPFETAQCAKSDSGRLCVTAAGARTKRGEVLRGRRPSILGLEHADAGRQLR